MLRQQSFGQTSYRALNNDGTVAYQMNISGSSSLSISTFSVSQISSDKHSVFSATSAISFGSNGTFTVPNDGKKYYWVPFDPAKHPDVLIANNIISIVCDCFSLVAGQSCGFATNGTEVHCSQGGCGGCCDESTNQGITGSGVVLSADAVNYNGVGY